MNCTVPEKMGIRSSHIKEYVESLENRNLLTHDIIIMRGESIVFEKYYEPFHKDFIHRMYSVTKSFVALAIGFLEQDGLINLDAPIVNYFPDELKNQNDENMKNQTIRHMLMMATAKPDRGWFQARPDDRVRYYFENDSAQSRPSGTIFSYDSAGSFVMGALVERITGKTLMEYLREKLFDKIGVSQEAYMLKCPGGHSWGDSAILCTPRDLLKVARFCLNRGKWDGEQILNEAFLTKATSKQIDNNRQGRGSFKNQGYGYQFWMCYGKAFFCYGMGCQFALCVPEKDMILVYNGDNQENEFAPFPQDGYSDFVGSEKGERRYQCAASAAWVSERQFLIKVQIIDKYFGVLNINFGFTEEGKIGIFMDKTAEDFLNEYQGFAGGIAETLGMFPETLEKV